MTVPLVIGEYTIQRHISDIDHRASLKTPGYVLAFGLGGPAGKQYEKCDYGGCQNSRFSLWLHNYNLLGSDYSYRLGFQMSSDSNVERVKVLKDTLGVGRL